MTPGPKCEIRTPAYESNANRALPLLFHRARILTPHYFGCNIRLASSQANGLTVRSGLSYPMTGPLISEGCSQSISSMSPLLLTLISALVLIVPWLLRPSAGPHPEIHGGGSGLLVAQRGLLRTLASLGIRALRSLPEHGPAILIANHTCGVDHSLLQASSQRVLGFMIAQEFYNFPVLHTFCRLVGCIPLRRDGREPGGHSGRLACPRGGAHGAGVPRRPNLAHVRGATWEKGGPVSRFSPFTLGSRSSRPTSAARPKRTMSGRQLSLPPPARVFYGESDRLFRHSF